MSSSQLLIVARLIIRACRHPVTLFHLDRKWYLRQIPERASPSMNTSTLPPPVSCQSRKTPAFAKCASTGSPHVRRLQTDILRQVFACGLSVNDLAAVACICKEWGDLSCSSEDLWKDSCIRRWPSLNTAEGTEVATAVGGFRKLAGLFGGEPKKASSSSCRCLTEQTAQSEQYLCFIDVAVRGQPAFSQVHSGAGICRKVARSLDAYTVHTSLMLSAALPAERAEGLLGARRVAPQDVANTVAVIDRKGGRLVHLSRGNARSVVKYAKAEIVFFFDKDTFSPVFDCVGHLELVVQLCAAESATGGAAGGDGRGGHTASRQLAPSWARDSSQLQSLGDVYVSLFGDMMLA